MNQYLLNYLEKMDLTTAKRALETTKNLRNRKVTEHLEQALTTINNSALEGASNTQVVLPPDLKSDCILLLKRLGYTVTESGNGALVDWSNS